MPQHEGDATAYSQARLRRMVGLSRHAIARLVELGFVQPTRTPGRALQYSFRDLVLLRSAQDLRKAGIPTRQILRALRELRTALPPDLPLGDLRVMATGDRVTVRRAGEMTPPWEPASGQMVMDLSLSAAGGPVPLSGKSTAVAESNAVEESMFLGAEALEETDPPAAEAAYRRLLELAPHHANAYLNLGFIYCESARFLDAAVLYEAGALHCADDPLIHFNRGVALEALHRSAEAVEAYQRALELQPELADAHQNAALLYAELGQEQLAIRHFSAYRRLQRGTR
ncbi:MAG: tetratricopeptide repeat protein [Variovorax sp.]|nr:MAG: tetratricopeptide repeat protein [Variovorax sp.]